MWAALIVGNDGSENLRKNNLQINHIGVAVVLLSLGYGSYTQS